MLSYVHPSSQPKRHLDWLSRLCTDHRRVSLFMAPLPPTRSPLPMGDLDHHIIRGSLGRPESSTQTESRSVQPFLQASLLWQVDRQTDRHTDDATRSVTIGRIHLRSTAMWPNNIMTVYAFEENPCLTVQSSISNLPISVSWS